MRCYDNLYVAIALCVTMAIVINNKICSLVSGFKVKLLQKY
ncbi:hypothetical protein T06_2192 [Trichinella sp. T6]|nr:hypothetical protein T06_2192 [Trichinella sp. T6]